MVVNMKNLFFIFLFLFVSNQLIFPQSAEEIIKKAEEAVKGEETAHGTFKMTIHTPDYSRQLIMEAWWQGNKNSLIITKSPKKEEGNKTLKIGNEMWQYLANTETTIKIPPSMMLQSWNGSNFTNDDLVRESNLEKDYTQKIIAEEKINGNETWKIELTPKPDAPVVWGKLYYWVRKEDYLPALVQYFDERGNMVRYLSYSDVKTFGKSRLPSKWTMYDNTKKDDFTQIEIVDMDFNVKIPARKFSFQELERGAP
jgi:outer membrane lipoprotein-sorting protein